MNNSNLIGLGIAAIGRPQYINIKRSKPTELFSLQNFKEKGMSMLDYVYDSGMRYFGTAPGYGLASQWLIDWVTKNNDPDISLATKWGYPIHCVC